MRLPFKNQYGKGVFGLVRYFRREHLPSLLTKYLGEKKSYSLLNLIYEIERRTGIFKKPSFWLGHRLGTAIWKVQWVDPADIKYQIKGGIVPFLQPGDWDLKKIPFKLHDFVVEHYQKGLPVEETSQYQRMKNGILKGDWSKAYWCKSMDEVEKHFRTLVSALDEIRNGGYKSHDKLDNREADKGYYPNEVLLSIDRDGNYLHESGGSHRLSMAKICNYKSIPAVVIRIHENQKPRMQDIFK